VLDVGVGSGKWGFLLREQTDLEHGRSRAEWTITIDGVEGYPAYIGDHQRAVYDTIHIGDALEFLRNYDGERYDVALALDIIEHFDPEPGAEFAEEALRVADVLVVTTPKRFNRQHDDDNPLQDHKSWWPRAALTELAIRANANVAVTQTVTTNIAVFSRGRTPPKVETDVLLNAVSALRDRLVPELAYYRLRGRTGPMLEQPPV
jgi:hypothetical protein